MTAAAAVPVAASTALTGVLAAEPRPARVLGWSPAALYLAVDGAGDGVVAVVDARSVRLPVAVVSAEVPAPADAPVLVGAGVVQLGDVALRPARWFEPRPRLRGDVDVAAAARARRHAAAAEAFAAAEVGDREADEVAAALSREQGGEGDAIRAAASLLGRGPGLTPSGDDVIAGVLAALALTGCLDDTRAASLLRRAEDGTTVLSAALLRCAARGEVIPQAAALLHALEGRGDLDVALHRLLQVGASSGAALALGLLAGVQASAPQHQEAGR